MGLYRWSPPSTEAHLLLTWEAKIFHPELMQDVSLTDMTKDFYATLFDYDLTDENLNMIYQTELNANSETVPLDGAK
jgi:iron complex transport system substrate-binding protein